MCCCLRVAVMPVADCYLRFVSLCLFEMIASEYKLVVVIIVYMCPLSCGQTKRFAAAHFEDGHPSIKTLP